MAEKTKENQVKVSMSIPLSAIKNIGKEELKKIKIKKTLSHNLLADELVNRYQGKKPLVLTKLVDENGNLIFSEENIEKELSKKGAVFATIEVKRALTKKEMRVKNRETKEPNPYLSENGKPIAFETYKVLILTNAIWQNVVDNKREKTEGKQTGWQANKKRQNGIENYKDCRAVCSKIVKEDLRFYINYIVLNYLSEHKYIDDKGNEIKRENISEYIKRQSKASKQKEANKHGLTVKVDPQIRQMKMSNIETLNVFGFRYKPVTG